MLLALLIPVPGLDGGPDAAPNEGRANVGGLGPFSVSDGRPGVDALDPGPAIGGGIDELLCGALVGGAIRPVGGPARGAIALPLALLLPMGGPFGGGGVAVALSGSPLAPAFLLIHLPRSGS
jgi:hypothetical protein